MNLSAIDWAIVVAYFALSMAIGLLFTKRGGESVEEYFLSGRNVPWWLAGAAWSPPPSPPTRRSSSRASSSPTASPGNWLWWNMLMSGMLTVFFFARLWRRAGVMTDVEFAELRYSGRPAALLRGFRALYLALPINLIILGWVTQAMIKILTISLGLRTVEFLGMDISGEVIAVGICFVITVAYSTGAGMWAVLWTDLVQFVIKMTRGDRAGGVRRARGGRDVGAEDGSGGALRQRRTRRCRCSPCGRPTAGSRAMRGCRSSRSPSSSPCSGGRPGTPAPSPAAAATSRSASSRPRRARRRARDAALPGRALRAPALAVDRHRHSRR